MTGTVIPFLQALAQLLAALAWPTAVLVIGVIFRKDIHGLLTRLLRGKVFGQEFELESISAQLLEVKQAAPALTEEVRQLPAVSQMSPENGAVEAIPSHALRPSIEEVINDIVREMVASPETAIVHMDVALSQAAIRLATAYASPGALVTAPPMWRAADLKLLDTLIGNLRQKSPAAFSKIPNDISIAENLTNAVNTLQGTAQKILKLDLTTPQARASVADYVNTAITTLRELDTFERVMPKLREAGTSDSKPPEQNSDN